MKLLDYKEQSGAQQRYFVELLDIGTHHRYQALRRMFYQQVPIRSLKPLNSLPCPCLLFLVLFRQLLLSSS